jgi:hypothetical protein
MEVIKKDLKDIEQMVIEFSKKVDENAKKSEENAEKIIKTMEKLHNHDKRITSNKEEIDKNSGTLEILHTINGGNKRFYNMWVITFTSLLVSIGFNIFLLIKLLLA